MHAVDPPGCEGIEQDLRVGTRHELVAEGLELSAQFLEVVDLAVEDQDVARIGGDHGLGPGRAEIDDRQPPMADTRRTLDPLPGGVGAAMGDGRPHAPDLNAGGGAPVQMQDPGDAAHQRASRLAATRSKSSAVIRFCRGMAMLCSAQANAPGKSSGR
jgi:hypothetical protein